MDLHYSQTRCSRRFRHKAFYYLMDLHYSQTIQMMEITGQRFYYLMDLHYSQTITKPINRGFGFTTLWIYTILKPPLYHECAPIGFTTLWIYTILKQ